MSWIYYPYLLVVGVAGVIDRTGLPPRPAPASRRVRWVVALTALAGLGQSATVLFMLFAHAVSVRSADTAWLYAPPSFGEDWAEVRGLAARERVFVLTDTGCAHELFPEVDSPRTWFLIPG